MSGGIAQRLQLESSLALAGEATQRSDPQGPGRIAKDGPDVLRRKTIGDVEALEGASQESRNPPEADRPDQLLSVDEQIEDRLQGQPFVDSQAVDFAVRDPIQSTVASCQTMPSPAGRTLHTRRCESPSVSS